MADGDFTMEAEALFQRFAERHGLRYNVQPDAPIEVLWDFPEQPKLSLPLSLGLQNGDELNFGVADFWSYFFPFPTVAEHFENILDAWVEGSARVGITGRYSRILQVRKDDVWETVYRAGGCIWPFRGKPRAFITN
jgi:hypothetical protein